MTRDQAIREACSIVALAFHSMGDYSSASDGFCGDCPAAKHREWGYSNDGKALEYVRMAVLKALKADGFKIDHNFDPKTGKVIGS
jgi:hypothetical protein